MKSVIKNLLRVLRDLLAVTRDLLRAALHTGLSRFRRPPEVLLLINLPQDLDMLLPLAMRLQASAYRVAVIVSDKAWGQSPRIGSLLAEADMEPQVLSHKAIVAGLQPSLRGVRAVVTASESTANAHRGPHSLTLRANQQGIATYTMQHGFENVGINYFDAEYPVGAIMYASDTCFIWGQIEQLPAQIPAETRQKCVAVGCPKFVDAPLAAGAIGHIPGKSADQRLVVVFENLHWGRYSEAYQQRFLQDLEQTALACSETFFLIKPHPTGLWLTRRYRGKVPTVSNLQVADPQLPEWERLSAPALIAIADAVITTPSTVALDAARANCPVAVVAYDLDLPAFEPLPLLRSQADWQAVAAKADRQDVSQIGSKIQDFLATHLVPGDAVQKIVDKIAVDIGQIDR
jgi:hypothetical protein